MILTRAVLAAVVVAVCLGGCSEDDPVPNIADPTASTPTVAASESASPTSAASPSRGPEETVRAWVDARNQALQDGNTSAVEAFSADSCKTCEASFEPIRKVYAAGGHFETSGWTVLASKVDSESGDRAKVDSGIEYAAGRTFPEAGSDPVSYVAEKHIVVFRLVREGHSWRVAFIGYLS